MAALLSVTEVEIVGGRKLIISVMVVEHVVGIRLGLPRLPSYMSVMDFAREVLLDCLLLLHVVQAVRDEILHPLWTSGVWVFGGKVLVCLCGIYGELLLELRAQK
jgi:hypothetical protein